MWNFTLNSYCVDAEKLIVSTILSYETVNGSLDLVILLRLHDQTIFVCFLLPFRSHQKELFKSKMNPIDMNDALNWTTEKILIQWPTPNNQWNFLSLKFERKNRVVISDWIYIDLENVENIMLLNTISPKIKNNLSIYACARNIHLIHNIRSCVFVFASFPRSLGHASMGLNQLIGMKHARGGHNNDHALNEK